MRCHSNDLSITQEQLAITVSDSNFIYMFNGYRLSRELLPATGSQYATFITD